MVALTSNIELHIIQTIALARHSIIVYDNGAAVIPVISCTAYSINSQQATVQFIHCFLLNRMSAVTGSNVDIYTIQLPDSCHVFVCVGGMSQRC